jgi:hypothetical protein|tara:strand:+ start:60 stop:173 length:114 start_codon:yes stop_codon:yes gene_type:complete
LLAQLAQAVRIAHELLQRLTCLQQLRLLLEVQRQALA